VQRLFEQSKQLGEISNLLRNPYQTESLELRDEAERWLKAGEKTSGSDRQDNWADAMDLLQLTLQNPIGKRDYVVWFQLGWLRWQHVFDLASAEEAFNTARRLSAPKRDIYHLKSLRYTAYMRYLRGECEAAYQAIQKALELSRDHETLYDCARYSAKTQRRTEAITLLDQCIDLESNTFEVMFSEGDFGSLPLTELATKKLREAQTRAETSIAEAQAAVENMRIAEIREIAALVSWDISPSNRTEEHEQIVAMINKAMHSLRRKIYEDMLSAIAFAREAATSARTSQESRETERKNAVESRQKALEKKIHTVIEQARALHQTIGLLAHKHAPQALAEAQTLLRRAESRDGITDLAYAELTADLALAQSTLETFHRVEKMAVERKEECQANENRRIIQQARLKRLGRLFLRLLGYVFIGLVIGMVAGAISGGLLNAFIENAPDHMTQAVQSLKPYVSRCYAVCRISGIVLGALVWVITIKED
jgi:hypothetical protein